MVPKHFVVQTAGCPSQKPGAAVPADSQDSRLAGSLRSVSTGGGGREAGREGGRSMVSDREPD